MKTEAKKPTKRGVISPYQLFFIFLVSRAVVALTFYQSILFNGISPDALISSAIALGINLIFCIPSYICVKYNKNPLDTKAGRIIYFIYFVFFSGVNISRFAFFACDKTTHGDSPLLFIIIMTAAACYVAYLGIEALGRFSVLCAVLSIIVLIIIVMLNIKNFHPINFMPFFVGTKNEILENSYIFSSNSIEPALFFVLSKRCQSKPEKPLFYGIFASYIAIFIMLLFCIGVLGNAAPLFSFPVYTLFQMTAFKSFSRLDIVYTAFGFFALFAKCAYLVYCSGQCIQRMNAKIKTPLLFFSSLALSLLIYSRFYSEISNSTRWFYSAVATAFLVIIPICFTVFSKRRVKNEKHI
ncbi:MAG: GerAB/ArcD/ProY family transporter [Eubacterium sp.]|nr:GerAB/ArcD/ProY family transporter [Eubacterium sp.]